MLICVRTSKHKLRTASCERALRGEYAAQTDTSLPRLITRASVHPAHLRSVQHRAPTSECPTISVYGPSRAAPDVGPVFDSSALVNFANTSGSNFGF